MRNINNMILNRMFTPNTIENLISNKYSNIYDICIERYIRDNDNLRNGELISVIYKFMYKNYRNEYFYKNTMLNKLLLGRHSLNTTTALAEIPIKNSKADFILINGKAVVYEIKTDLDNFDRLFNQINDYYKAFNNVVVVSSENNYEKVDNLLKDTKVGILILSKRGTLSTRKSPIEDNSHLDHEAIFKVLRKQEFENIILNFYKKLPQVREFEYYANCLEWFSRIPIENVYRMSLSQLKKRNKLIFSRNNDRVPYELKSLFYFSNFKEKDYDKLQGFLSNIREE
ncbi:sce7726 family protein [Listeria ivanovii]|uniref:sce7726 family protein n=1 Tax=Listeria ivanovii TaxID=1638 RepID=UPI0015E8C39B|nr:sce7726 family protein [Listeria ivanovii]